ncbi:MFS transporter-like protein [Bimuria novae-zelandiae CBS 107.79]|uniref:MFS transporter-like protein n=1 Tax=Bimuria novae-zelandiae CBS 107.79 TaxID=1447943 RepID=A0A6A5UT64_9PLEO|nr:MFS transporter-like protein [Bimuria novae-zelandiae CBS 107.79]
MSSSPRSSLEEGAPLLSEQTSRDTSPAPPLPVQHTKKKPWVLLTAMVFVLITIVDAGAFLAEPPKTRVFEANLCLRYYEENDPSKIDKNGSVPEALCKIDEVQQKLAMIFGWQDTFDAIPGLILAIPFGALADKWGRKWIFVAALGGLQLNSAWILLICYFRSLPLQMTWFSSAFYLLGGGPVVASAVGITMISDIAPPDKRTTIFLYLTASVLIAEMCAPIMASTLMQKGVWFPLLLALAIQQVGVTIGVFFPETLHLRDLPEPRDAEDVSIELQTKGEGHGFKVQLKHFKSALLLLTSDLTLTLVVCLFVVNRLGRQATTLLIRYASKRYNWEISKAAYLLSFRAATNLVAVAVFIPIVNITLIKYLRLPVHWADLWLMRGSLCITAIGFLAIAVASQPTILIFGLLIFNLGTGSAAAMRSVSLHVVGGQSSPDVGKLMSLVAVSENIGVMLAGPLLNEALKKGMDLGSAWLGLPFFGVFVLYILATVVSCIISVKDRDLAYVEVATDEEADVVNARTSALEERPSTRHVGAH